ncbi:M3 family metallopeptidase [Sphingomonas sp. ASV193]|uniref:M3 family metallopeptidase n=1 Tax=Sphingomonas sp. ASV193 TaxID=3144405 RepID=UPI0032E8EBD1
MVRTLLFAGAALALTAPALAKTVPSAALPASSPFARPSSLPYGAPDFAHIKSGDYLPALMAGMAQRKRDIDAIAKQKAAPTFDNTIGRLEQAGPLLERTQLAFNAVLSADTDDTLDKTDATTAPLLTATNDYMNLNKALFARVKSLHDRAASLNLTPEQARLLDVYYKRMVHAGAELPAARQAELKTLNGRISSLESSFSQKLTAATAAGALHVTDRAALAGLSDDAIAAAAEAAKAKKMDGWLIALQNTTGQPALGSMSDRATRLKLFGAGWTRAEKGDANDTRALISELAALRAKKAALLGYPSWAAYALYDQMAKTPDAAIGFLARLAPAVSAKERAEAAAIQAVIDQQNGGFKATPADWDYYSEQVRKARYDYDEGALKPYFSMWNVLENGVFYAANQLYGLTFKRRTDLPTWDADMRVYEVSDANGKPVGLAYFDYYKRDNKQGGAWMDNLVVQAKSRGALPVIYNVCNFTRPAAGKPPLVSFDDVTTMFHEFGHGLHGLFADQQYPSLSGANTARDFVEFPSQFNENWALDPKVLANYAKDYRTGAPIPAELVAKVKAARTFNQGHDVGETLTAARLDLDWHSLPATAGRQDVDGFEAAALAKGGFDVADVPSRYRTSYFRHIWSGGYAAGYYAYPWTRMLAQDAFAWFESHGGLTLANGDRFRALVLSRGNTEDYGAMFRGFAGHDPSIQPYLAFYGFDGAAGDK